MSIKSISKQRAVQKNWGSERQTQISTPSEWVRPTDWLTLTPPTESENKFVGLHAVYPDANFLALSAEGDYTVDWGDGVIENFASGAIAQHIYNYATYDVSNSTLCSRGYKQVIVTVTPQEGQTFSALNLNISHNQPNLPAYNSGFLDIALAGADLVDLYIGRESPGNPYVVLFRNLERVNLVKTNLRQCAGLFRNCISLRKVVDVNTSSNALLIGTCSFTTGTNLVTLNNHGRRNGDSVIFTTITGPSSISVNTCYFVTNATENTFQLSSTFDGDALVLDASGSGEVTFGTDFSNMFYNCNSLQTIPLLDTAAGINFAEMFFICTSLQTIPLLNTENGLDFSGMFYECRSLQTIPLLNTANGVNFSNMFINCRSLQSIPLLNTGKGKDFSGMFGGCTSLQSVPLLDTAEGINFASMFNTCTSLQSVPLLDTAAGTDFTDMFNSCSCLQTIPPLNTAAGTNFNGMFNSCSSLQNIPLLDTAAGIDFSYMFCECRNLKTIPLLNTAAGTNFNGMFINCRSLQSVPLLNTAAGTDFTDMFNSCTVLQTIPLLDTANGVDFTGMFYNCTSLQNIPLLDTAAGTNFSGMFDTCNSLQNIPSLNVENGVNFSNMIISCPSLHKIDISGVRFAFDVSFCKLSEAALTNIIDKLGNTTSPQNFTIYGNFGAVAPISLSGTTTAGSTTVTMPATAGIQVGMQVTGAGTPSTTPRSVTFTASGSTVGLTAHGLSNGDEVSFASVVTTTGIVINKIYYVVNASANTFQIALTPGGSAVTFTNNGTGTIRYKAIVTAINPNVSITLSRPASSSGTNTLSFRTLKTNTALLKGWTVIG